MPFKHYIRSIEGKTEAVPDKPYYPKPTWFTDKYKIYIHNFTCMSWFSWSTTPQGYDYWAQYHNLRYHELPPEPREIIDSWIAQVNGEL